jgi:hypothetical protein
MLDTNSSKEGRFLSYTKDYTDFIKEHGEVVSGPDLRNSLNGLDFKSGVLNSASFDLRCLRNKLLYSELIFHYEHDNFVKEVVSSMNRIVKLPKRLIYLRTGELIPGKEESVRELKNLIPEIDYQGMEKIFVRLRDPEKLYQVASEKVRGINLLSEGLELVESMIGGYIRKFPVHTEREYKR